MENIDMLIASICDEDRLREILAEIVPTYKYRGLGKAKEVNGKMIFNA